MHHTVVFKVIIFEEKIVVCNFQKIMDSDFDKICGTKILLFAFFESVAMDSSTSDLFP